MVVAESARRRLAPEARRDQLVQLGLVLLRTRPLEQLSLEDVAAAAGISRALPFHYFPTRQDFLVAVITAAADEMLAATDPGDGLPALERLRAGLEGYIDYIETSPAAYVALVRGAFGGDRRFVDVIERTREVLTERIMDGLGQLEMAVDGPLVRLAVRGWLGMVEEATVAWLGERHVGREDLVWMLDQALVRTVFATVEGRA
jgi:AcrR family transcriptional regulator